jgi:predicted nucleotide-binding protein
MIAPGGYGAPGAPGAAGGEEGGALLGGPGGFPGGGEGGAGAAGGGPLALQYKAVTDFLDAVKAKNKDRLAEVVALRAPIEAATPKNKKLFSAILDQSISDAEVDEIAKALEGFQIVGNNEAKSSGRLGIIIAKTSENDYLQRTVTVRKEAKGWRVVDISPQASIDGGRSKAKSRR